ncbi:MAG: hypothetical protein RR657_02585 [Peptostreptococcaceae bacterium]
MRLPIDDDLYEELDKLAEKFGMTTDSLAELAIERLIKDINNINK